MEDIDISLAAYSGNPDLFVGILNYTSQVYFWESLSDGTIDHIRISHTDENFSSAYLIKVTTE